MTEWDCKPWSVPGVEQQFSEKEIGMNAAGMQFGAVVKFGRQEAVLVSQDGKIIVGSIEDNKKMWGNKQATLVPMGTKEQIEEWQKPVVYIEDLL